MIFFDHNATTPISEEALKEHVRVSEMGPVNCSSLHGMGRVARKLLDDARSSVYRSLNISRDHYHVIFTSCGTESNNLALNYPDYQIFYSATDHSSVINPAKERDGVEIRVHENGLIDLNHLESLLKAAKKTPLVSIGYVNNETGVIQTQMAEIIKIVHDNNGLIHSDLTQAIGKISIDFTPLDFDFATISSHKIYGPQGAALLLYKNTKEVHVNPIILGGGQEFSKRSGTENIAAISSFALALAKAVEPETLKKWQKYMSELQERLEKEVIQAGGTIIAANQERIKNTSVISMVSLENTIQLIEFDLAGFMISIGSACSSGKTKASHVLQAMKIDEKLAKSAIRVSFGWQNTIEEVNQFISKWKAIKNRC